MDGTIEHDGSGRTPLPDDLQGLTGNAHALRRGDIHQIGERREATLASIASTPGTALDSLSEVERQLMTGAREAMDIAHRYVQRNPWQSVGIGALAGLALGLLIGRR